MSIAQTTQIFADISETTSSELDRYADARGLKKGYVIEQALRHHLRAVRELPPDAILPPQLIVSVETAEYLAELIENPPLPTPAMRALLPKK
jgi:hypothetical protein